MSPRLLPLAAFALIAGGCVTEATAILVIVDTDIPPDVPVTIRVTARAGEVAVNDARRDLSWLRLALDSGPFDGGAALPASFGVTPSMSRPRDQSFTLLVEAVTGGYTLRRSARLRFTPGRALRVPIYLTARCAAPATDCTTVPAAMCTVQQSCEDRMQTCGAAGTCVDLEVQPIDPNATHRDAAMETGDGTVPAGCGPGMRCCEGGVQCGVDEVCTTLHTCAVCGDGRACCASGTPCPSNHVCTAGSCRPCGGAGQACCELEVCGSGTCVAGRCETSCGGAGQPCCASSGCGTSSTCTFGTCNCMRNCTGRCGGASDGCGGTCNADCGVGQICRSQRCMRCGVLGAPCCPGDDCSDASQTAFCCTASTEGRPNCPVGASDRLCHVCGEVGQPCCAHQTCNTGGQSTCGGTAEGNNVICRSEPCGVAGGYCCSWRIPPCEGGLNCEWATGRCL